MIEAKNIWISQDNYVAWKYSLKKMKNADNDDQITDQAEQEE